MVMLVHPPSALTATPRQQLVWQIALIDQLLSTARAIWMGAAERSEQKAKAYGQLNLLLDRRLEFMKARDEMAPLPAAAAPQP